MNNFRWLLWWVPATFTALGMGWGGVTRVTIVGFTGDFAAGFFVADGRGLLARGVEARFSVAGDGDFLGVLFAEATACGGGLSMLFCSMGLTPLFCSIQVAS